MAGLGGEKGTCNTRERVAIDGKVLLTVLLSVLVQVPMDFSSRNEDAAKSWQLPKHFAADESSDSLFADTQFGCSVTDVQRLTFGGGCRGVHNQLFTSPQNTTRCDFSGVACTQSVIPKIERGMKARVNALAGRRTISPVAEVWSTARVR
jgi:hypothetical protein